MVDVSRDDLSATVLAVANEAVISSAQEQASVMEELRALDQQLAHLTTMHTKLSGDPESARSELHAEFNAQVTRIESMRECLGMDFGALQHRQARVESRNEQCRRQVEVLDGDIRSAQDEVEQGPAFARAIGADAADAEARLHEARASRSQYLVMWHQQWQSSLQIIVSDVASYRAATTQWSSVERASLTARINQLRGEIRASEGSGGGSSRQARVVGMRMGRAEKEATQLRQLARLFVAKRQAQAAAGSRGVQSRLDAVQATQLAFGTGAAGVNADAGLRLREFVVNLRARTEGAWRDRIESDASASAAAETREQAEAFAKFESTKTALDTHFDTKYTGAINDLTRGATAERLAEAESRDVRARAAAQIEAIRPAHDRLQQASRGEHAATAQLLLRSRARVLAEWTRRGTPTSEWGAVAQRVVATVGAQRENVAHTARSVQLLRATEEIVKSTIMRREELALEIGRLKEIGLAGALPQSDLENVAVTLWESHNALGELDAALREELLDFRYRFGVDLRYLDRPYVEVISTPKQQQWNA